MAPTTTGPSDADKAAVAAVPGRIVAAWADHDDAAFAQVFTPDGTMILPGVFKKGQDDIRAFMAESFAGPFKGTRVTGDPLHLTFLSDSCALLITRGGVLAPGESEVAPERAIRATWTVVKDQGTWHLAAYQNTPAHT
ncbi:SgcJ/EcaC family oxidoreductase [Streptomyces sp. G45]|uniref:SgcJ/EcaC family oxidoreductase n=1 Tax=Streptomyces sp. G45 TaxID=3406627 RepID=UPI003C24690F